MVYHCTLIHLMGYRAKFELLDFSYHIMKLMEVKPVSLEIEVKQKK
jgi:hypothetical protein